MDLSIITSLYNRLDLTRAYLASLESTLENWRYEVILIDDGSTDGTRDFLLTLPAPRYRVLLNEEARGYAVNNNAGARLARAPLLCLLNNDIVLLPGWLEPMARLARWGRRVALVGNIQREPVSGLIDHWGVYFRAEDGLPLHAGKNRALAPDEPYLAWPAVTAACCVVRKNVFLELGGFDEEFRNGFEDVDFCLRASTHGYRHYVANRSAIYHHVSASPNRRLHEDANRERFRARWRGRVPLELPSSILDLHHEGRRYLRKHRRRPWRYNYGRLVQALRQWLTPWPAQSRPGLGLRWALRLAEIVRPASATRQAQSSDGTAAPVFLVVEDTVRNPGRSGIQTVVRSLVGALGRARAPVRAVVWDAEAENLSLLPPALSVGLAGEALRDPSAAALPLHRQPGAVPGGWVLLPELMYRGQGAKLVDYVHRHGWRLAVIFYDAIPVNHPQFMAPESPALHAGYMRDFSRADLILPISEVSAREWREFVAAGKLPQPAVRVCALASDLAGTRRVSAQEISPLAPNDPARPVNLLCISTIEPRKNHRALLAAYELAAPARPDLPLTLSLVGAPFAGADSLADEVKAFVALHPLRVRWYEQVEYSLLRRLYVEADFTVYPSVLEGFGLPIIESLWFGRPCICADFGVMAENAAGGGCLTVNVRDPRALADAILALADSPARRHELALAATTRPLKTWDEYADEVLACLREHR